MRWLRSLLVATGALVLATTALGPWSPAIPSASAATGGASATITFSCKIATFPAYAWKPTVTVSAVRPEESTTVTLTGHTTDMAGASPVPLDYDATTSLKLDRAGEAVTLTGAGRVKAAGYAPFPLPDTMGTFTSSADEIAVSVSSYTFVVDPKGLNMTGTCTPTGSTSLGTLTIASGTPPTPTPTPTTISSATAKPSAAATTAASGDSDGSGTPARGKVTFACVLNPLSTKFSYPATVTVAGYRANPGDDVTLSATMTNLPGIAPVAIDGTMNVTLGLTVGGTKTTLSGSTHAKADPKQTVPVPTLTGKVAADGDELKVLARSFTFDFPDLSIDADCTASSVSLGTLTVGTEAASAVSDSSGTLPATGVAHLGALLAWATGLIALGAAALVFLRRTAR